MTLGEFIKQYRTDHGLSIRSLAKATGLTHSYIAMLERNYNYKTHKPITPNINTVSSLATAMNISLQDMLEQIDNTPINISDIKPISPLKAARIPVLGSIPAGVPIEAIEDIIGYEDISDKLLKSKYEYFGLKVDGNSMYPEYRSGDTLIIRKQDTAENGQDAIVMVNGNDATFKRFFKNDNGITLQAINPEYQSYFYSAEDVIKLPIRIIGIPIEVRRSVI